MTSDDEVMSMYPDNGQSATPSPSKLQQVNGEKNDLGGWSWLLILAGVTCSIGSAVPAGFNIGIINNPAPILKQFCNESIKTEYNIDLTTGELKLIWSIVVSIFLAGGVSGSLITSWIADKYGRRGALAIGNVFAIFGGIFFLFVPMLNSVGMLMMGRLLVGLAGGITTSILPMYMTEISSVAQRGAVGVLCQLGITAGVFLGQIVSLKGVLGTNETWHIMLASFVPLSILALSLHFTLPESPKYLYIIRNQKEKAIRELHRLRDCDDLLEIEIRALQEEFAMRSTMDVWTIGRVLKDPTVRLPLLLVSAMQLGQQLSGINAVFFYSNVIFEKAELKTDIAQYATLATGVINIGMAVISVHLMSNFGRRTLFLCSSYASAACLLVLCIAISAISVISFMPWLCMIAVLLYVLFYGLGLGPISFFIGSEIFDVAPRPAAMALGSVCNWGGNLLVGLLFPTVEDLLGPFTFLIFVACIMFVATFVRMYLPETRGINTRDITARMTQGFQSRLPAV